MTATRSKTAFILLFRGVGGALREDAEHLERDRSAHPDDRAKNVNEAQHDELHLHMRLR